MLANPSNGISEMQKASKNFLQYTLLHHHRDPHKPTYCHTMMIDFKLYYVDSTAVFIAVLKSARNFKIHDITYQLTTRIGPWNISSESIHGTTMTAIVTQAIQLHIVLP